MSASSSSSDYCLLPPAPQCANVDALCLGSGRFLRAVLVPALIQLGHLKPVLLQPRGTSLYEYCSAPANRYSSADGGDEVAVATYEVDTVAADGVVHTERIPCFGVISLADTHGMQYLQQLVANMQHISVIGVGVTEAALSSVESPAVEQLATLLYLLYLQMCMCGTRRPLLTCTNPRRNICVINTDNIPDNGTLIQSRMLQFASTRLNTLSNSVAPQTDKDCNTISFLQFIQTHVVFLNTMVDRITSERDGSLGCIPRAEPIPRKALVIEDLHGDLPTTLLHVTREQGQPWGLVLRNQVGQLQSDVQLKLRIANATHTAIAHAMALSKLTMTQVLSNQDNNTPTTHILLSYLDTIFTRGIYTALQPYHPDEELYSVYQDWKHRLTHAHFGLSTFFITQNGPAKCGIRIGPTLIELICQKQVSEFFKKKTIVGTQCFLLFFFK